MEHTIRIQSEKLELAATVHYPNTSWDQNTIDEEKKWPVIIICHGFVGSRIGVDRLFVKAARDFSRHGYMVLRFDYGGCGESTGDYGASTLEQLIDETRRVIDYALDMDCIDPQRIILLGHSLGGAVSLLTSALDRRVRTLVLWASVAHPFNDIVNITGKRLYDEAVRTGYADYLGYRFQPAFFESLTRHQPLSQLRKFSGDVLIVHGTGDTEIPVDYCFLYQKLFWLRQQGLCDKEVIFQGDHTFSNTSAEVIAKTRDWLLKLEKNRKDWNDWTI